MEVTGPFVVTIRIHKAHSLTFQETGTVATQCVFCEVEVNLFKIFCKWFAGSHVTPGIVRLLLISAGFSVKTLRDIRWMRAVGQHTYGTVCAGLKKTYLGPTATANR
jgi:hypothetical protein